MKANPASVYAIKLQKEESLRAISKTPDELQLHQQISSLQEKIKSLEETNKVQEAQIFDMQACMILEDADAKNIADKKIKQLESALAFKEQETNRLLQEAARRESVDSNKRKVSEVYGLSEGQKAASTTSTSKETVSASTSTTSSQPILQATQVTPREDTAPSLVSFYNVELLQAVLHDFHCITLHLINLPAADSSSPSSKSSYFSST